MAYMSTEAFRDVPPEARAVEGYLWVHAPACPFCRTAHVVSMPRWAFKTWHEGAFIQRAWPQGTADERELLVSGTCPKCWDEFMGVEDD